MKTAILKYMHCAVFVAALSIGSVAAVAGDTGGAADDQQTKGSQVKNVLQSGAPEQAATLQMGITPEQLSSLMGGNNQEQQQQQQQQQRKFVYTPKDPTEVEKPPRLFYNIPKWH